MSHPSLGLPPRSTTDGFPEGAARIRATRERTAARALDTALAARDGMRDRYDDVGLRRLLRDTELLVERVAMSVGGDDPSFTHDYAGWTVIVYRRRGVPMDDLVAILEGIRSTVRAVLSPAEMASADVAIDAGIEVYHWSRRLAGDARKKNAFLQFLYKGG